MRMIPYVIILFFCLILMGQYIDYPQYPKYKTWDRDTTIICDTCDFFPPDTFDTAPLITFSTDIPETLYVLWKPSEIDSTDIDSILFAISHPVRGETILPVFDGGGSTKTLRIPWSIASVDSDTFVVYESFSLFDAVDVWGDTSRIVEVIPTLRDSTGNSVNMATIQGLLEIPKTDIIAESMPIDTMWFSETADTLFIQTLPNSWSYLYTWLGTVADSVMFFQFATQQFYYGGEFNKTVIEKYLYQALSDSLFYIVQNTTPFVRGNTYNVYSMTKMSAIATPPVNIGYASYWIFMDDILCPTEYNPEAIYARFDSTKFNGSIFR